MKNTKLAELNFLKLLHYSSLPDLGARSSFPRSCTGICVSCEKNGFLDSGDHRLDQMSHGADTEDFEKSISELPPGGLEVPVAFLLESPGGYYRNGDKFQCEGITKQPPVNCYYWAPRSPRTTWPKNLSEFPSNDDGDGMYGPYFAYIIATHKLHNAYFTNIIKCSLAKREVDRFVPYNVVSDPDNRDSKIRTNCYNLFLREEMRILNPEIVFYFGTRAAKMGYYLELSSLLPAAKFVPLYHPAARSISRHDIIDHNDQCIQKALTQFVPSLPQSVE